MKKIILLLVTFIFIQPAIGCDINNDNIVNVSDIVFGVNYIINDEQPASGDCDFNGDGVFNIVDIVALYSYILGSGPSLPPNEATYVQIIKTNNQLHYLSDGQIVGFQIELNHPNDFELTLQDACNSSLSICDYQTTENSTIIVLVDLGGLNNQLFSGSTDFAITELMAVDNDNNVIDDITFAENNWGDVNEDGFLNIIDVIDIVNIILWDGEYNNLADANSDGIINIIDVINIVNWILNEETEVEGCIDDNACNYNPDATIDDGNCDYINESGYHCGDLSILNELWNSNGFECSSNECAEMVCSYYTSNNNIGEILWENGRVVKIEFGESCNTISSLPENFGNLEELSILIIEDQDLTFLPISIGNLNNLTELHIHGGDITSVPNTIGNLSNLINFHIRCDLVSLPTSIYYLSNLEKLSIPWNEFTTLPEDIVNLTNLDTLDVSHNALQSIPNNICDLPSSTFINLSGNELCDEYYYDCIDNMSQQQQAGCP